MFKIDKSSNKDIQAENIKNIGKTIQQKNDTQVSVWNAGEKESVPFGTILSPLLRYMAVGNQTECIKQLKLLDSENVLEVFDLYNKKVSEKRGYYTLPKDILSRLDYNNARHYTVKLVECLKGAASKRGININSELKELNSYLKTNNQFRQGLNHTLTETGVKVEDVVMRIRKKIGSLY